MQLSVRKQKILTSVVQNFIQSGEPVGSKAIAQEIGVSSATIRNEMAELFAMGFLEQPHTSAGRVPSQKGYRQYVNLISEIPLLRPEQQRAFDSQLYSMSDPERLLSCVCEMLMSFGDCMSLVSLPSGASARVKAVQFVQISRRTAMLILMSSAGTVKNRIFRCDFDLTNEIMRIFFRVFNERIVGLPVSEITIPFIQSMAASLDDLFILSGSALIALLEVAQETVAAENLISGHMNLLRYTDFGYAEMRNVINFFENKEAVTALFEQRSGNVFVFIGTETGKQELTNISIVAARYAVENKNAGVLALIGPDRMNYSENLAAVSFLSERVSSLLTALTSEE